MASRLRDSGAMETSGIELVGWLAAVVLFVTIAYQVYVQWRSGAVAGVSPWLFTGQLIASVGFLAYSALLQSWVFVATNAMMALAALVGKWVDGMNRQRAARRTAPEPTAARLGPRA